MSKSIRSKWKRKCRAIKRERYAVKELARLKMMLGIKEENKEGAEGEVMETEQEEQVIFLDANQVSKKTKNKNKKDPKVVEADEENAKMSSDDEAVEVVEEGKKRTYSMKTMKDQNGQYPVWLHKRKIAKITKKTLNKKSKKRKR